MNIRPKLNHQSSPRIDLLITHPRSTSSLMKLRQFRKMGSSSGLVLFLVLSLIYLVPGEAHEEEGYISVLVSNKGMDFAKDVLIDKAVSSMIPLRIPDIERTKKIPLLGKVRIGLSGITIYSVSFASSYVETGESTGVVVVASGATAEMSMRWKYSYKNWVVEISDSGDASVQVDGMDVGVAVALTELGGSIKLKLMDCGCYVKGISIKLDGGASWLYQAIVDVFDKPIRNAVEDAVSKKLRQGISTLDSHLQSLPKSLMVANVAMLNVTFVENPEISNSSIELEVNGLFRSADSLVVPRIDFGQQYGSVSWSSETKMIRMLLHEDVLNSASLVYFNTGHMHWTIEKLTDQSLLNTSAWEYVYPDLIMYYADHQMNLCVSVTSAPIIKIFASDFDVTIAVDLLINVLEDGKSVPVACVSLAISSSCSPQILGNNLAGNLVLKSLSASSKWTNIGDPDVDLLETIMSTIVKTSVIPYVNARLTNGIPLPVPQGFLLQAAEFHYGYSKITVLCDVSVGRNYHLIDQPPILQDKTLL